MSDDGSFVSELVSELGETLDPDAEHCLSPAAGSGQGPAENAETRERSRPACKVSNMWGLQGPQEGPEALDTSHPAAAGSAMRLALGMRRGKGGGCEPSPREEWPGREAAVRLDKLAATRCSFGRPIRPSQGERPAPREIKLAELRSSPWQSLCKNPLEFDSPEESPGVKAASSSQAATSHDAGPGEGSTATKKLLPWRQKIVQSRSQDPQQLTQANLARHTAGSETQESKVFSHRDTGMERQSTSATVAEEDLPDGFQVVDWKVLRRLRGGDAHRFHEVVGPISTPRCSMAAGRHFPETFSSRGTFSSASWGS